VRGQYKREEGKCGAFLKKPSDEMPPNEGEAKRRMRDGN
jgi:hypothetical protein